MIYKYSIPSGWLEETLNDYCIKVADGTHDSPKVSESGKLLVTSKNIIGGTLDLTKSYLISENDFHEINKRSKVDLYDVLLSMIGTVGEVCLIQEKPDFAIKNVGLLKNTDPIKANWLYFYLTSPQAKSLIKERLRGTTQQYLPLGEIRKFPIIYPESPDTLNRLVTILASLKNKIELNNQINQTLESMAQAIFKSWFVDFEPVKAKMAVLKAGGSQAEAELAAMKAISGKTAEQLRTMRTTQAEDYQQLTQTAALFPTAMQESELGEIPEEWSLKALGDICTFSQGSAFKNEHQGNTEGDYPFIKVSDMNLAGNEVFILNANNFVTEEQKKLMNAKVHPAGSTVFAKIGVALTSNRRRLLTSDTIIDNNLMSVSPNQNVTGSNYLYLTLTNLDFNLLVSGTALPYLNVSDLRKIQHIYSSSEIISRFESITSALFSQIKNNASQNNSLANIRDSLLPKLLSGELEV